MQMITRYRLVACMITSQDSPTHFYELWNIWNNNNSKTKYLKINFQLEHDQQGK